MADKQTEADIIFNRANVALARSQRLIASWLPPKPEESTTQTQEDDEDWGGEDELAGVGSKRKAEVEGLPDGAFKRRHLASNDRLLEQIMGKKAAQAKKKQDAKKVSLHTAPKPLNGQVKQQRQVRDDSESEEEGRAAAFRSKKQKRAPPPQQDENVAEQGKDDEAAGYIALEPAPATGTDSDSEQRPQKKVKGSYLDELLSQKAKKSKKKKKKNKADATSTT